MPESGDNRPATEKVEVETRLRVGYAFPTRKLDSFMLPPFINHAKKRGIDFIPIDESIPLSQQGPFDCVIHKLYGTDWRLNLEDFALNNPNAVIVDPPSAIDRLYNRITMLESVTQINLPRLGIPNQLLLQDTSTASLESITKGLKFPVIAKPLLADGSAKSHKMSLVFNREGLTKGLGTELEPPVVLQEFVNHGGIIFKVYVADDYVKCVKRNSLADISEAAAEKMSSEYGGIMSFSQISNTALAGDDKGSGNGDEESVKMPEEEFVEEVGKRLRKALGLHLFNLDMIREKNGSSYLVIDINFFPGYEKLPDYESVMTDFFSNAISRKRQAQ